MRITVVGCGDAFGSGGRLNTCFHVETGERRFLIDCGASTMIGLQRLGLRTNDIEAVFVTHLHGDHFGGLPWLLIDANHRSARTQPLTIVGPPGLEERFRLVADGLYAGATERERAFDLRFVEIEPHSPFEQDGVRAVPFIVQHPCGAPPFALRFEIGGKVLAFSGDTSWTDALLPAANGADLFICESYQWDKPNPVHLDFKTIDANFERLAAKRILLTHMGDEMLSRAGEVDPSRYTAASDGMVLEL